MRKLFLFVWAAAGIQLACAQSDSTKVNTLKEVVVSASRREETLLDAPRSVTVITRDKIENSTYNSVGDLLSKQQGIYVVGANQTPGTNQSLFLRGANSNQVLVMIDGVRITDPSSPNNAIDLSELSLVNVERIEIIEGAHSTLYGGSAIGGVVNIITRKDRAPGIHGFVSMQGGTYGQGSSTFSQQADLSAADTNGLYLNASIFNQQVNGLNAALDTAKNGRPPDTDGFTKTDYSLKGGYRHDQWDVFAAYRHSQQRADVDGGAFQDDDNAYVNFRRDWWNGGISYQFDSKWRVSATGSSSHSRRLNQNDSSLVAPGLYDGAYVSNNYFGKLLTYELQVTHESGNIKSLLGAGSFSESMHFDTYLFYSGSFGGFELTTNYDSIKTKATTRYVFGQIQLRNTGKFGLTAGGRWSRHSLAGNYGTVEVNPSFAFSQTDRLFATVSTGFNPASLYQLYDPTKPFGAYTSRGNPDLKPETSVSVEGGFKKEFSAGSYLTVSAFYTSTRNAIEYVYLWQGATPIPQLTYADYMGDTYINISRQEVRGAEVSGAWSLSNKFVLQGNVTLLDGKVTYSAKDIDNTHTGGHHVQVYSNGAFVQGDVTSYHLVRRPPVTGFGQLRYIPLPAISLSIDFRTAGHRYDSYYDPSLGPFGALNQLKVATYGLFDVGVSWKITKVVSVVGRVENVFNTPYSEISGYATRGRSAYIKLNIRW